MIKTYQNIIQFFFLLLFLFLALKGKIQIWMLLFIGGLLASTIFSRFYCGWICPINTCMNVISSYKKKKKIADKKIPNLFRKPWVRWFLLALFLVSFIAMNTSKVKFPLLPFLFFFGLALTLIYPEALFHRNLCPFGTLLSLPSALAKRTLRINTRTCISCGKCEKLCPAEAITHQEKLYQIDQRECLLCRTCQENCPVDAILYCGKGTF